MNSPLAERWKVDEKSPRSHVIAAVAEDGVVNQVFTASEQ
jgi:hypothetical protein